MKFILGIIVSIFVVVGIIVCLLLIINRLIFLFKKEDIVNNIGNFIIILFGGVDGFGSYIILTRGYYSI